MRALAGGSWDPEWDGPALPDGPVLYATAHVGSLLALRYLLRARGVAAASVIAPYNFDRPDPAAKDARFDRRFPMKFPHVVSSEAAHRIRSLLQRGSLIVAADLPGRRSFSAPLLGGVVDLDSRPFRLARMAGVPCVPIFLTLPGRRWTVTVGEPLPVSERAAQDGFAAAFARAAARAPLDLDGLVYWTRSSRRTP
jgi:lauroyl/myristoyl acyltransferase